MRRGVVTQKQRGGKKGALKLAAIKKGKEER